ncbi:nuclear transport factor 2 family protein [Halobacterium litoreum]|uniref:Nuclear transport factor 2 family protein n=1 Tax=Halobacterium litoreum TaxID=2039234 RepID=A0ABD5NDH1_9EURY|nr:nuclear transport factor 2 family protein [Halobacterium litoreum]UHH13747.1 nuclear transport factor 2 family protein [Halobacterium litoreum]
MASDPESVVDRQVEAYNDGDVAAFVAQFAEDAVVAEIDGEEPMAVGEAEIRELYGGLFESVEPTVEILSRMTLGEYVVDHERLEQGGEEREAVGVYRVREGVIDRLWLVSE